jgi:hypothetical protein
MIRTFNHAISVSRLKLRFISRGHHKLLVVYQGQQLKDFVPARLHYGICAIAPELT